MFSNLYEMATHFPKKMLEHLVISFIWKIAYQTRYIPETGANLTLKQYLATYLEDVPRRSKIRLLDGLDFNETFVYQFDSTLIPFCFSTAIGHLHKNLTVSFSDLKPHFI